MTSQIDVPISWSRQVVDQLLNLKPPSKICQATYIWIDGTGGNLRSKTRTIKGTPKHITDFPEWDYDGSLTGEASGMNSDMYLKPVAFYQDPFLGGNHKLVLCETYNYAKQPSGRNRRYWCNHVMYKFLGEKIKLAVEQEYVITNSYGVALGYSCKEEDRYCSLGAFKVHGREIAQTHYTACLRAGLEMSAMHCEAGPSRWKFQLGPIEGIAMADQLWTARYILCRVAEMFSVKIAFDAKEAHERTRIRCHISFSTEKMREPGGLKYIEEAVPKLAARHEDHVSGYDASSTRSWAKTVSTLFTWGVGNGECSIRIPRKVAEAEKGFLEDRRPLGNCDPYQVISMLTKTILLD